ncbi:HTTM domain-containing protein [Sulfidibacter corallicola]|uniref:HTTM domain-containing protein n=1 Tax=Sulfidibacter corallicola TaxID=2818388 RepID=A0A8A4TWA5_SULCO|nr:HTTM domain-containing protein [Sulfidibacter corallicola]QTD50805.1 HTTM domain-containing protein [Sulfidibacter corallicola]
MKGVRERLMQPVDAASLGVFRICFGLMMAGGSLRFLLKGWVDELYVVPEYHFTYFGFEWVRVLPSFWMHALFIALIVLGLMVAAGLFYRAAIVSFFVIFTYVELIDKTNYLNHYYFISLIAFLMIWLPAGRVWSLDALRRPDRAVDQVPAWCMWCLRLQMGVLYFFAGLAKVNPDWLFQAEPLGTWLRANAGLQGIGSLLGHSFTAYFMSWSGMIYDLTIPFWLLWSRSRPFAYATVIFFHFTTAMLFYIGMFPWVMMVCTLLFFPPDWPRPWVKRFATWFGSRRLAEATGSPGNRLARITFPNAVIWGMGLFFLVQLVLPMRYLLYPGNVLWHEQGFRFSWRVMLVEKTGHAEFRVVDRRDGRQWRVDPAAFLTLQQRKMMSTQPDMILEFAHFLGDHYAMRGCAEPAVFADVWVSWNGRRARRLIDPEVDLFRERESLLPKHWILPEPESAARVRSLTRQ